MTQRQQLRKKIKQLKYKIDKEQKLSQELQDKVGALKKLQAQEFGSQRIFKKINLKLKQKGMKFNDWLNCLPYDQQFDIGKLLKIGEELGLQLNREESDFLLNFLVQDLCAGSTAEDFTEEYKKSRIYTRQ